MANLFQTLSSLLSSSIKKVQAGQIFDEAKALYDAQDYKQAFPLMKKAAEFGSPFAMAHLGVMCLQGLGTPCDWKKAAELFEMTLKLESYQGTFFTTTMIKSNLGLIYGVGGYGLGRDFDTARQYLQEAADEGDAGSADALQMILSRKGVFGQKEKAKPEIKWR